MNAKAKIFIVGVGILVIGISIWAVAFFNSSLQDEIYDQLEITNTNFKLRITAYRERGVFLPGVYFMCQSTSIQSDNWREIITVRGDEPHPIRREQINFVTDHIGYIFKNRYYMVTTDSGNTWSIWDSEKNLFDQQYRQQHNLSTAIEEVKIQPDGNGVMKLHKYFSERERGPDLITTDYGIHWILK